MNCDKCGKRIAGRMRIHQLKCTGPKKCYICGEAFDCFSTLEVHATKLHKSLAYACTLCRKEFVTPTSLVKHQSSKSHIRRLQGEARKLEETPLSNHVFVTATTQTPTPVSALPAEPEPVLTSESEPALAATPATWETAPTATWEAAPAATWEAAPAASWEAAPTVTWEAAPVVKSTASPAPSMSESPEATWTVASETPWEVVPAAKSNASPAQAMSASSEATWTAVQAVTDAAENFVSETSMAVNAKTATLSLAAAALSAAAAALSAAANTLSAAAAAVEKGASLNIRIPAARLARAPVSEDMELVEKVEPA